MRPPLPIPCFFRQYAGGLLAAVLAFTAIGSIAAAAPAREKAASRSVSYRLRPMDLVKVQVFQEPDLDRELRVSHDYTIVAPLIGVVDVHNLTVREAELLLTELYKKDYLVNPQINMTVMEYAPRNVNVLGAVNAPGSVVMTPEKDMSLLDAIARSGGFSRLANRTRVSLTRTLTSGQTENYTVNADELVAGDNVARWMVQDGDIIYVPERLL
jgi:polysaccharide export outer membrane protein